MQTSAFAWFQGTGAPDAPYIAAARGTAALADRRGAGDYGTVAEGERRVWGWEKKGQVLTLLVTMMAVLANRCVYLALLTFDVLYTKNHLLSCNPDRIGLFGAMACEMTKACVRFFPILGLLVLMMVASRMLLQHRIYYQVLKRGALIDFDNFNPLNDPLFIILVADFVFATLHFVMLFGDAGGFSVEIDELLDSNKGTYRAMAEHMGTFYIFPAAVFLSFLHQAYDTEAFLVPLSKYMEEDSEAARNQLAKLSLLPERNCARAALTVFWSRHSRGAEDGISEEAAFRAFIRETTADRCSFTAADYLGRWRLSSTLWPGKILLDRRLLGDEAQCFRYTWYFVSVCFIFVFLCTGAWTLQELESKVYNVTNGQADTDWPGVLVIIFHAYLWFRIVRAYVLHTCIHFTRTLTDALASAVAR